MGHIVRETKCKDFESRFYPKVLKEGIPFDASLELTFRCNLNCVHCSTKGAEAGKGEELSTEEIKSLLDQAAELGTFRLLITGGEPLVRNDFLEIYTYAKKKGMLITIFTNGTLVSGEVANWLLKYTPYGVEISLYGVTRATYEKITRVPGSFEQCMRGIQLLNERKISVGIKTPMLTLNKHKILKLREYAKSLRIPFRTDPIITRSLINGDNPQRYRVPLEEAVKLEMEDKFLLKKFFKITIPAMSSEDDDYLFKCRAKGMAFHINPYGKLQVCMGINEPSFDLRKMELAKAIDELRLFTHRKRTMQTKCTSCPLIRLCKVCPAFSWQEHGNYETPVEWICQKAHLEAEWINKHKLSTVIK